MDKNEQIQKAGEGANQFQAGIVAVKNIYVGITEKEAREIFADEMAKRAKYLAVEAQDIATKRMLDLFADLMARVKKCEKDLSSFSDPGFLQNLRAAQEAAAVSERKEDIEILSELLLARMNGKLKRSTKTGLRKAIEIVPEMEDKELTALTVLLFCNNYCINSTMALHVDKYLANLDGYFAKIVSTSGLPQGARWLQHLSILNCVEVNPLGSFAKLEDYYTKSFNGIICVGIAKGSPEHIEAVKIMNECGLGADILVQNDLLPEYVRLPLVDLNDLSLLPLNIPNTERIHAMKPTEKHKEGLKKVISLYKKDGALLQKAKSVFGENMSKCGAMYQFREWLVSQKRGFELTPIGEALAYVNARRCIPELPIMELE